MFRGGVGWVVQYSKLRCCELVSGQHTQIIKYSLKALVLEPLLYLFASCSHTTCPEKLCQFIIHHIATLMRAASIPANTNFKQLTPDLTTLSSYKQSYQRHCAQAWKLVSLNATVQQMRGSYLVRYTMPASFQRRNRNPWTRQYNNTGAFFQMWQTHPAQFKGFYLHPPYNILTVWYDAHPTLSEALTDTHKPL